MFSEYKIIKKITENLSGMDEVHGEHLRRSRRGVADDEANSIGMSVGGEFTTPRPSKMVRPQYLDAESQMSCRRSRE
jgi:hypothetical protein